MAEELAGRSWVEKATAGNRGDATEHHGGDQLATMPAATPWSPGTHQPIKTTLVGEKTKSESLR